MEISAVIIAGNEEKKIREAIESVLWAEEVLVVDSESTDATREVAGLAGARVIVKPWAGFSAQKQFAVDSAKNDWILSIDADERVTPELRDEIGSIAELPEAALVAGYRIPRRSIYMQRLIRHSGWYPDLQLRLFDRRRGRWSDHLVHESWQVGSGERVQRLQSPLLHYGVDDAAYHHRLIGERYAPLAADQMYKRGERTSAWRVISAGPSAFLRSFLVKAGFLDGLAGYAIARFAGHSAFLKHLLLWEMQRSRDEKID